MAKWTARSYAGAAVASSVSLCVACAKTEYIGNTAKGFWSDNPTKVAPASAFAKAQPYLDATWEVRCEKVRHHDEYCDQPPLDHMVRRRGTYYITRTSYPYEDYGEFTKYAVRVDAETGEVTPLQ